MPRLLRAIAVKRGSFPTGPILVTIQLLVCIAPCAAYAAARAVRCGRGPKGVLLEGAGAGAAAVEWELGAYAGADGGAAAWAPAAIMLL